MTQELDPVYARLAGNVKARRKGEGLSAQQVADRSGGVLTRGVIANLESGRKYSVTVLELLALATALDVPPVWLLCAGAGEGIEADADGALAFAGYGTPEMHPVYELADAQTAIAFLGNGPDQQNRLAAARRNAERAGWA